jgi:hypothetical protein
MRTVFLYEMDASNSDFLLVWPGTAEVTRSSDQQRSGLGVDEQFRQRTVEKPLPVVFEDFHDVGGFATDR